MFDLPRLLNWCVFPPRSATEAERIADSWLTLPHLSQLKQLGVDLVDLARAYNQSGDQASAQSVFQMALKFRVPKTTKARLVQGLDFWNGGGNLRDDASKPFRVLRS